MLIKNILDNTEIIEKIRAMGDSDEAENAREFKDAINSLCDYSHPLTEENVT